MSYNAEHQWSELFKKGKMMWPSEYVIRIFSGHYPRLDLKENLYNGMKICDVGCGDGRNLFFLKKQAFEIYGVEITEDIVAAAENNLKEAGIDEFNLKAGKNNHIPFENSYFDYLLSWNACYYMGDCDDFQDYVKEFARVLKKDGYFILSIPKCTCFIFKDSEPLKEGYRIIRNDPFGVRNGEIMRIFQNEDEIKNAFSGYFDNFIFGSIQDDCFGYNYHWHLVICRKR